MNAIDTISNIIIWVINFAVFITVLYWVLLGSMRYMPIEPNRRVGLGYKFYTVYIFIIAWIYAVISRGEIIYLLDRGRSIYITVLYRRNNTTYTYLYFFSRSDKIYLDNCGRGFTESVLDDPTDHLFMWLPHNKYTRMEMILLHNIDNFV